MGERGMSAYVEDLIQRQVEREHLRELIEWAEAEHGPVDPVSVQAKRAILRGEAEGSADAA
ncbi:CopG family transcriptional regulator [Nocardiopsis potens]|uniref:CopG family transcriptional regulator n=1 Tax=Nocardiopsis potens TaxID=1246458 RepID=UPI0019D3CF44|nr:CopG family transcriptional regulator [Nocardiopsis potens]